MYSTTGGSTVPPRVTSEQKRFNFAFLRAGVFMFHRSAFTVITYSGDDDLACLDELPENTSAHEAMTCIHEHGFIPVSVDEADCCLYFGANLIHLAWWHTTDPFPERTLSAFRAMRRSQTPGPFPTNSSSVL